MDRMFKDCETGEMIPEKDLFESYITNLRKDPMSFADVSFEDYIMNSSTLVEVKPEECRMKTYRLQTKYTEVWHYQCDIRASSREEAKSMYCEEPYAYNMEGKAVHSEGWCTIDSITEIKD